MKVSLDPCVSSLDLSFRGVLFLLFLPRVLNFRPDELASLKIFLPCDMDILAGVMRSCLLVAGVGIVALQVLKLSSLGILFTFSGVFNKDLSLVINESDMIDLCLSIMGSG